jgi:hypothetical protein
MSVVARTRIDVARAPAGAIGGVIAAVSSRGVGNTKPVACDGAMAATTQLHTNVDNIATRACETLTADRRLRNPFGATTDTTPPRPPRQANYQPLSTNR